MKENIIQKIKNLQQKTVENGCTEAEASASAELIRQLLLKYNIEMQDVDSFSGGEKVEFDYSSSDDDYVGRISIWKYSLMASIAKHYFCNCYLESKFRNGKKCRTLVLVGKPTNTAIARAMYDYLSNIILSLSLAATKEAKSNNITFTKKYADSWRNGCIKRISERLEEKRRNMYQEGSENIVAIQVVYVYEKERMAILKFLNEKNVHLRRSYSNSNSYNKHAYSEGYKKGSEIGLDTQISKFNQASVFLQ